MLLDHQKSCLLLVDVQEKLTQLVDQPQILIDNCKWLLQLARELEISTIVCEQYPQGLGETVVALKELAVEATFFEKLSFSCASHQEFSDYLQKLQHSQIVIIGIEAHVCVLQTAIELHHAGYEVFVVADAISSRYPKDIRLGIKRMRKLGIQIVSKEMVFFEWLRESGTPLFKRLSKQFF